MTDGWPGGAPTPPDNYFSVDDGDTIEHWVRGYQHAAETSRQIVSVRSLDDSCVRPDFADCTVRFVVLHMIEETARHAGHADIIRETLDGSRGI